MEIRYARHSKSELASMLNDELDVDDAAVYSNASRLSNQAVKRCVARLGGDPSGKTRIENMKQLEDLAGVSFGDSSDYGYISKEGIRTILDQLGHPEVKPG